MMQLGGKFLCVAVLVVCGCNKSEDAKQAGGSSTSSASPAAAPAQAKSGSLVHTTFTKDECTFDFDAPEALKEKSSDGLSVSYESASFKFDGFAGSALYRLEGLVGQHKLYNKNPPVYQGTDGGVHVVVARIDTSSSPLSGIQGRGEEAATRSTGCSFICSGVKEREADVIAMCKSARLKYDESKVP
ncbi:hypothetical protein [Polyangium sp. 15x6]|uniref:hypothetical protein n=1 Tax=Polyangium sp. 15x6 TaxID=3042687 RepID=UPI00249CAF95|nr:hypothetical protein [Polyangium sp. 15x6]MDI3292007.1 hypothetical protein [Polyangium sp. 15x6]